MSCFAPDRPEYDADIARLIAAIAKRGGAIGTVGLNQAQFELAREAVRRGDAIFTAEGTAEQTLALVVRATKSGAAASEPVPQLSGAPRKEEPSSNLG